MDDREVKFMPREEGLAAFKTNSDKITELNDRMNRGEGKGQGLTASWQILLSVIVLIVGLIEIFTAFHK